MGFSESLSWLNTALIWKVLILPSTQCLLSCAMLSPVSVISMGSFITCICTRHFCQKVLVFSCVLPDINLIFLIHIITILCKRNNNTLTVLKLPTLNIEKLNAWVWKRRGKSSTEMKWKTFLNYTHNGLLKPVISCFFLSSPINACTKEKKGKLKNILHTPAPLAKYKSWFKAWQTC